MNSMKLQTHKRLPIGGANLTTAAEMPTKSNRAAAWDGNEGSSGVYSEGADPRDPGLEAVSGFRRHLMIGVQTLRIIHRSPPGVPFKISQKKVFFPGCTLYFLK